MKANKETLFENAREYYNRFNDCLAFVIEAEPIELKRLEEFIKAAKRL